MSAQANALRQAGLSAYKAGLYDEALRLLQQAAGADPDSYETFSYLGAIFARQSNYESARRAFGRAVQVNAQSPKARFNLGTAHQMAGDADAARVCFEAALNLDPSYAAAQEALDKLPPKVISMSDLAAPGGAVRLPGAQTAVVYSGEPDAPAKGPMTPEEMAKLAAPSGHLHMMGAQATDEDRGT